MTPFQINEGDFSYTLSQGVQKPNKGLIFSQKENNLLFNVTFASGGGDFEAAKLVKQDNVYKMILYNTDGMFQNMIVSYELSGEISNISSGNFTLQIVNSNDKNNPEIIMEKEFKI